jgi:uncharacterized membrane protein
MREPAADVYIRDSSEFGRSLSFFDAIYGFALTLLIANLDLPPEDAWRSLGALLDAVGSQLLGFVISFVVIVVFWRSNSRLVARLTGLDARGVTLNIVLAGLIILIPFTTQGISDPGISDLALPTILYAINLTAAILVQIVWFDGSIRRGLERVPTSPRVRRAELLDGLINPAVLVASIPVALVWGGSAAKYVWFAMLVLNPLSGFLQRRAARRAGRQGPAA